MLPAEDLTMPISCPEIKSLLDNALPGVDVDVQGADGKFQVQIVSGMFEGMNRVKRQQTVYRILHEHISSGAIHAVSMILKTPAEA
jgi:acid stress-induced BolA-like protein IbaG/YrbA